MKNIIKNWFENKPLITKNKDLLSETYNQKYGDYDYSKDSRVLDKKFDSIFSDLIKKTDFENVIICGSNSGFESEIILKIKPDSKITAVDISDVSLDKLHKRFSEIIILHKDLEKLDVVESKEYDLYVCLRAIHSTNINILNAVKEAVRITKKRIIISVSNGYIVDGKLVNGMFDYEEGIIDPKKPFVISAEIVGYLNNLGWNSEVIESDAEIFIVSSIK